MKTHGMKPKYGTTREYTAWSNARSRCRNRANDSYRHYGGRGIKVLFKNFEEFFEHMGPCPHGMSLDRIDNNGHYGKGNVRWADQATQMSNRSDNRILDHKGKKQTLAEWSRETGLSIKCIWRRIEQSGWTIADALDTPRQSASHIGKLGASSRWRRRNHIG